MTKWNFQSDEVNLTHDQMVELNKEGSLNLIIVDSLEKQIDSLSQYESKNINSGYKLTKRKIIALGVLGVSFYFGINESWGWLVIGIIAAAIIVLKKGNNNTNFIDLAIKDADFFEKVKEIEGWIFQIEEGKEKEYLNHPAEEDVTEDDVSEENDSIDEDEAEKLDDAEEIDDEDVRYPTNADEIKSFVNWVEKILGDFADYVEKSKITPNNIVDTSELPHAKDEIFLAHFAKATLVEDEEIIPLVKANTLALADHQENVGPKQLSAVGVDYSEISNVFETLPDIDTAKKEGLSEEDSNKLVEFASKVNLTEEETKRYEEFKELVDEDISRYYSLIDYAEGLREKSFEHKIFFIFGFAHKLESINIEEILEYRD